MRIISGKLKGRIFNSPSGFNTHPMSEKARGAIFNALGDISGLTMFDAYGGSGAIGFEAISRGIQSVVTCDTDKHAFVTIKNNIKQLGLNAQASVINANCVSYLANQPQQFDIIIADPPYKDVKLSQLITLKNYVNIGGLLILSLPPTINSPALDNYELLQNKSYGDATIYFYRRIG